MWYAVAEYADGTRIEKYFPYHENGNYNAECERQNAGCCHNMKIVLFIA